MSYACTQITNMPITSARNISCKSEITNYLYLDGRQLCGVICR